MFKKKIEHGLRIHPDLLKVAGEKVFVVRGSGNKKIILEGAKSKSVFPVNVVLPKKEPTVVGLWAVAVSDDVDATVSYYGTVKRVKFDDSGNAVGVEMAPEPAKKASATGNKTPANPLKSGSYMTKSFKSFK